MRATLPELLFGVALDLAIGDPRWLPHPVRAFGWLVVRLERLWRAAGLPLRVAGACFCLTAVAVAAGVTADDAAVPAAPVDLRSIGSSRCSPSATWISRRRW